MDVPAGWDAWSYRVFTGGAGYFGGVPFIGGSGRTGILRFDSMAVEIGWSGRIVERRRRADCSFVIRRPFGFGQRFAFVGSDGIESDVFFASSTPDAVEQGLVASGWEVRRGSARYFTLRRPTHRL